MALTVEDAYALSRELGGMRNSALREHQKPLAIVERHGPEGDAVRPFPVQRPAQAAYRQIDIIAPGELFDLCHFDESDLAGIAEYRGGYGTTDVDIEPDLAAMLAHREARHVGPDPTVECPSGFDGG